MPLPTPNAGEEEQDFISRCMGNETVLSDFPDEKQRAGVCYSQWNKKEVGMEGENEKCLACMTGATSFEELDKLEAQEELAEEMSKLSMYANVMTGNIFQSENIPVEEKPNALKALMDGFMKRIKKLTGSKEADNTSSLYVATEKRVEGLDIEGEKQATKLEEGIRFRASDYAVVPDAEKPSTWKLRLAENSSGNFTVAQIARAVTAMQPGGFRGQKVELTPEDKSQAISRISAAIGKSDGDDNQKKNLRTRLNRVKELSTPNSSFWITKDAKGNMRWYGFPSNKWRDRDVPAQIISEEAHKDFVDYLEKTKEYPVLLSWHTPGTQIGKADWAEYTNGFLIMGGPIDKDKHAEAEKLAELCQKEAIGMSHGFVYTYANKEKEIIGKYRAWEVSHLPLSKAANVWTSIDILRKELKEMQLSEEKKKYLVELHGQDVVESILNKAADLEKDMVSAGVEFKDIVEPEKAEVDTDELVKETAKAIVESEGFKTILSAISGLETSVKTLTENTIPEITQRMDGIEQKATKKLDDAIADAMKSRSSMFQPSKDGPDLNDKEKEQAKDTEVESKGIDPGLMAALGGPLQ